VGICSIGSNQDMLVEHLAETGEDIGPVVLSQIRVTYEEVAARTDAPLVYVKKLSPDAGICSSR
jgi:hypothetical protein